MQDRCSRAAPPIAPASGRLLNLIDKKIVFLILTPCTMRRAGGGVTARPRNKGRAGLMADRRISGRTHGTARFRAALAAGGIMLAIASVGVAVHAQGRATGDAPVDLADPLVGAAAAYRQERIGNAQSAEEET